MSFTMEINNKPYGYADNDEIINLNTLNARWNKAINQSEKEAVLHVLFCDTNAYTDEEVFVFLKDKDVSLNGSFFINSFNQPTVLKGIIDVNRPDFFECFLVEQNDEAISDSEIVDDMTASDDVPQIDLLLERYHAQWQLNSSEYTEQSFNANFKILRGVIENESITDEKLTQFLSLVNFRWNGGWFKGTDLDMIVFTSRPQLYQNQRELLKISDWSSRWQANSKTQNFQANVFLLLDIFTDKTISDQSLEKNYITPQNISWSGNFISTLKSQLFVHRPNIYDKYFKVV